MMRDHYDVIVIGGGPAGATTAALVAQSGNATLLLERDRMPRFHVGESLMPESYWTLNRLGVLEAMKRSTFVKKVSVQFVSSSGKESQPFFFKDHDPHESVETWQVERADFDKMLFDNAAERGADCFDQTRVLDVLFDRRRATGVRLQRPGREPRVVTSRVVVDATGQQALIATRLGLKQTDPRLKKAAIWGYYRNAWREPGEHGGGTIILHTCDRQSWFWNIPLSDNITSIGLVADADYLLKGRGKPADVYEDEMVKCPALVERLMHAEMISDLHVAKEFSYSTTQHAGDGWVLVGDAFGFIDPIYSSGVFLALRSGELAADAIVEGLRNGDTSARQLGQWTEEFTAGTRWMRKLVDAFYTDQFSFGAFLKEHPECAASLTDLLIGRIFDKQAGRVFEVLEPELRAVHAERAWISAARRRLREPSET